MKKSLLAILAVFIMTAFTLAGCGSGASEEAADPGIPDGTYVATFTTDSPMFHVSEANNDKGILTVKDGQMTIHVSLQSKKIVNLYYGLAEDAQAAKDLDEMCERNVILDDLGAENIKNEYGVKRDIVGEFICRYHTKGKGRLFITTNLRGPELLDRYGGRVVDRLKQLCVPFHMKGKSKRQWL